MSSTSWETSEKWYDAIVGKEGHYYHQNVVIPNVLRLLDVTESPPCSLLDLACGQGVLARALPKFVSYQGVDLSSSLIKTAQELTKRKECQFTVGNICEELPVQDKKFTHSTIILALQNVEHPENALIQASKRLLPKGTLVIVLNHPCFRIARQSHWGIDETKKLQYRKIDRYMTPLKIPIQTTPSLGKASEETWTFHHPLSFFSKALFEAHLSIEIIEEWTSNKQSTGRLAKMENRAREEFPLFLCIKARKN